MKVPVSFRMLHAMADKDILVDSGATDNFIHPKLLKWLMLGSQALDWPQKIWNIDRTTNRGGQLTHFIDLEVRTGKDEWKMCFLVTDLGNEDLILEYPWLSTFKPKFSWREGVIDTTFLPIIVQSLDWRKTCFRPTIAWIIAGQQVHTPPSLEWIMLEREKVAIIQKLKEEYIGVRGILTNLAIEAKQYTTAVEILKEYQPHTKVFSEEESKHFPPEWPWDHVINLKPGSPDSLNCKIYPTMQK